MHQVALCDGCTLDAFTLGEDCLGRLPGEIVDALVIDGVIGGRLVDS